MRIPTDSSPLGAAVVAMAHLDDFQRLGATDLDAGDAGLTATFASSKQANVARELVSDAFLPEVDGVPARIPFHTQPTGSDAVGRGDAIAAIARLQGVAGIAALDRAAVLYIGTADAKSATRLDALLRDRILGMDVIVEEASRLSGNRGWGDGIG